MGLCTSFGKGLKHLGRGLLDFIYPRPCPICELRLSSSERAICTHCATLLSPYNTSLHNPAERLYACPKFQKLYALFFYEKGSYVQRLIHNFKYKSHTDLIDFFKLSAQNQGYFQQWQTETYDLILAVPISKERRSKRGYNQAFLMAKAIADEMGVEPSEDLILHKNKSSQTRLNKYERITNTESSFYLNPKFRKSKVPKRVLLVDDVLTTGATLLAVAFLLEELGVERIDVFTITVAI